MLERAIGLYNPEIIPASKYDFGKLEPDDWGTEKLIYRVEHGGHILAAKIFRVENQGSGVKQNRQKGSLMEFELYKSFKKTPLGIHVPEAFAIITGRENLPIGLAVKWVDGEIVGRSDTPLLTPEDIDLLESGLVATTNLGIYPSLDMYDGLNLILSSEGERKIWFAECAISANREIPGYQRFREAYMERLRDNFMIKPTDN